MHFLNFLVTLNALIYLAGCQPSLSKTINHPAPASIQKKPTQPLDDLAKNFESALKIETNSYQPSQLIAGIEVDPILFSGSNRAVKITLNARLSANQLGPDVFFNIKRPTRIKSPFDPLPEANTLVKQIGNYQENQITVQSMPIAYLNFNFLALHIHFRGYQTPTPEVAFALVYLDDENSQPLFIDQIKPTFENPALTHWLDFIQSRLLFLHDNQMYHEQELLKLKKRTN